MVYYKGYKIFKKDGFFTVWLKYQRRNYRLRQFRYYDLIKKSINFDLKCKKYIEERLINL